VSDSVTRFSGRVNDYAQYRPHYPQGLVDILRSDCGLTPQATIADVGSGTGMLSELFLSNGNTVIGVEPNPEMRGAAEQLLSKFAGFASVDGTAEATTLNSMSADFVTAGQSFHWFVREKAKLEFARILKPAGWVVLVWNERRLDATPFLQEYEKLLLQYGTDYQRVRHEMVADEIGKFFAPEAFHLKSIENVQLFDYDGLRGRTRSASYTPEPGAENFEPLYAALEALFQKHEKNGQVTFEYDTRIYYGHLEAKPAVVA
jgi:SAM-dependent methyltransferase